MQSLRPNSVIRGEVILPAGTEAWIEANPGTRGAAPLREFYDDGLGAIVPPRPGEVVPVLVEAVDPETGAVALSHRKGRWKHLCASEDLAWRRIEEGYLQVGDAVAATVVRRVGGGLGV